MATRLEGLVSIETKSICRTFSHLQCRCTNTMFLWMRFGNIHWWQFRVKELEKKRKTIPQWIFPYAFELSSWCFIFFLRFIFIKCSSSTSSSELEAYVLGPAFPQDLTVGSIFLFLGSLSNSQATDDPLSSMVMLQTEDLSSFPVSPTAQVLPESLGSSDDLDRSSTMVENDCLFSLSRFLLVTGEVGWVTFPSSLISFPLSDCNSNKINLPSTFCSFPKLEDIIDFAKT